MGVYSKKNKDGSTSWVIQYFVDGQRKREVVPTRTRKQAELALAKRKIEIKEGRFWEKKNQKHIKFKNWANNYIKLKENQGRRTLYVIKLHVKHLMEHFGEYELSNITSSMIEDYLSRRRKELTRSGQLISPASVNRELAQLKNIFTEAQRNGIMEKNPAQFVEFLKENNKRDRVLNQEELEHLIECSPEYLAEIILFAYYTGMRKGEILKLTWEKVDLKNRVIQLHVEDTKTLEAREVPLNDVLVQMLQEKRKLRHLRCPNVFTYQGKAIGDFKKAFRTTCIKAGIKDFRFHDLRHTFVTNARKAGIHDFVIMAITGHKTQAMFRRYNTVDREDILDAVKHLPEFLSINHTKTHPKGATSSATRKNGVSQGVAQVIDFKVELDGIEPTTS